MSIQQNITTAVSDILVNDSLGKKWYASKTFWTNVIAAGAIGLQMKFGFIIDANMQALALTIVNIVLRKLTKEPITF